MDDARALGRIAPEFGGDRSRPAADEDDQVGALFTRSRVSGTPPLDPTTPTQLGWVSGIVPWPEMVVATAMSSVSTKVRKSASPLASTTPPPTMTTGNAAERIASTAASIAPGRVPKDRPDKRLSRIGPYVVRVGSTALHVDRQAQMRRSGAPGGHLAKSGSHHVGHGVGVLDDRAELGERPHQPFLIQFGQRVVALASACRHPK